MTTKTMQRYRQYQQISYFREIARQHPELRIGSMLSSASKIGTNARTFSLPLEETCFRQGIASPHCSSHCYEYKMRDWGEWHEDRAWTNLPIAKRHDFDRLMIGVLRQQRIGFMKPHLSGDFFSTAYIRAWLRVMRECSDIMFWSYTRSWRVKRFHSLLSDLAVMPNHRMHLSLDASDEPGDVPMIPQTGRAWLALHSEDQPSMPVDVTFPVFVQRRYSETRLPNVCPHYIGKGTTDDCVACGRCLPP